MKKLLGCGAAPGCARGAAACLQVGRIVVSQSKIDNAALELEKLQQARDSYFDALQELIGFDGQEKDAVEILESYIEILEDEAFFSAVKARVENDQVNVDYALEEEEKTVMEMFSELDDPYLMERATDIGNVCNELIRRIQGKVSDYSIKPVQGYDKLIIFAEDLTPDQTLQMDRSIIGGFVTEKGGLTSHTVILAKTLGIPAVVGTAGAVSAVHDGQEVLIYGQTGEVILAPDEIENERFAQENQKQNTLREAYSQALEVPACTKDGYGMRVCVNVADWKDESELDVLDTCDGVGLYRSEFIFMQGSDYPTEEEQFQFYRAVVQRAGGNEVIIRTLDIGGDKMASYMDLPPESNPFLGYRAIRLCLGQPDIFRVQLRAILRASAYGKAAIMFPMIASVEELRKAKALVEQAKEELRVSGMAFDEDIHVGIMVETPAAVQLSDLLAKEADFFSIGTNDLIQYTTATDRMNDRVQYLYDPCSLSVLRSVNMVCKNAKEQGIPVNMCGEAASDELLIPVWTAMGLSELSVVPGQVAQTKYIINHIDREKLCRRLPELLSQPTKEATRKMLQEIRKEYGLVPGET